MDEKIYFMSDTHFGHDKDFIYAARGYNSIAEHDIDIVNKINVTVAENDTLYLLGDVCMGDIDDSIEYLKMIQCKNIHIILGNHDTTRRIGEYSKLDSVKSVNVAEFFKHKKWHFYLSHYPSMTANMNDSTKLLRQMVYNISGHTHSNDILENSRFGVINVAVDALQGFPIEIEEIKDIIRKNF